MARKAFVSNGTALRSNDNDDKWGKSIAATCRYWHRYNHVHSFMSVWLIGIVDLPVTYGHVSGQRCAGAGTTCTCERVSVCKVITQNGICVSTTTVATAATMLFSYFTHQEMVLRMLPLTHSLVLDNKINNKIFLSPRRMCVVNRSPNDRPHSHAHRIDSRNGIINDEFSFHLFCRHNLHATNARATSIAGHERHRVALQLFREVHDVREWVDFGLFFSRILSKRNNTISIAVDVRAILHVCAHTHTHTTPQQQKKRRNEKTAPFRRSSQNKQSSPPPPPTTLSLPPLLSSPCIIIIVVVFVEKFHREAVHFILSDCTRALHFIWMDCVSVAEMKLSLQLTLPKIKIQINASTMSKPIILLAYHWHVSEKVSFELLLLIFLSLCFGFHLFLISSHISLVRRIPGWITEYDARFHYSIFSTLDPLWSLLISHYGAMNWGKTGRRCVKCTLTFDVMTTFIDVKGLCSGAFSMVRIRRVCVCMYMVRVLRPNKMLVPFIHIREQ